MRMHPERTRHANGKCIIVVGNLTYMRDEVMRSSAQRTAGPTGHAARMALNHHHPAKRREHLENSALTWHGPRRSSEVYATTATQPLERGRGHAEPTTDNLWRALRQAATHVSGVGFQRDRTALGAARSHLGSCELH